MDSTVPSSSGASTDASSSSTSASGRRQSKTAPISVKIQPTIGPGFSLSLPPGTKVSSLKDIISDKMGLSPQKMTLLFHSNELMSGTLSTNGIENGTEIRLVPAIESGVTTVNSVDPVAMMKHSMSGISDQQIEDFLNGKSPLSVAIRVGESVVVVNLHRAKVEEIEMEPPPTKRRCVGPRQIAVNDADYPGSGEAGQCQSLRHLNSNNSPNNDVMEPSDHLPPTNIQRRSSRLLERSMRSTRGVSPVGVCDPSPTLLMRETIPKVQEVERQSSIAALLSEPSLGAKTIPIDSTPSSSTAGLSKRRMVSTTYKQVCNRSKYSGRGEMKLKAKRDAHHVINDSKRSHMASPLLSCPSITSLSYSSSKGLTDSDQCASKPVSGKSVSHAVQTDPESVRSSQLYETRHHHKSSHKRELKLPENGISMKRKAVMDAISEILKKMYANSEKGRLPGSFKGRFSSEFTCDSNMHEILHSKTTMTSYGDPESKQTRGIGSSDPPLHDSPLMSRAKFEENEQLKDKVAHMKWKMQHYRAIRMAKRQGEKSVCGWMEALNCSMPQTQPKEERDRTGFCGLKSGFLLSDSSKV